MYMRPVDRTVQYLTDAGLRVDDVEEMAEHYVRTVDVWYDTFEKNWARAVDLVGDESG